MNENEADPVRKAPREIDKSITARTVFDIMNPVSAAVENLSYHQEQCDHDGVMVKVSRQALNEVLEAVNQIAIAAAQAALAAPQPAAQERGVDRAARCTCGIMCQDLGKDAGCRYLKPEREALRKLVDAVYQHATESAIFPATVTADLLIDRVFGTGEIADARGTILECADVARLIGSRMSDTRTDFGAAKEIEVAIRALAGKETDQ